MSILAILQLATLASYFFHNCVKEFRQLKLKPHSFIKLKHSFSNAHRIRNPDQGKINARIDQLKDDITATSTSYRKKLEREHDKLVKQQAELQTFDEKLRHYAGQRISLDLDGWAKVNYAKFGDLMAEVKAVTVKKENEPRITRIARIMKQNDRNHQLHE